MPPTNCKAKVEEAGKERECDTGKEVPDAGVEEEMNRDEIELQTAWDAFMGGGGATILVFYKFMCWFRKWRKNELPMPQM